MTKFRKALIRYFSSLPPYSRPCRETERCPITVFRRATGHKTGFDSDVVYLDPRFADAIDSTKGGNYLNLFAKDIVRVAKTLG